VATGDQFVAQIERRKVLYEMGADVVEMEGASVAQVALAHQCPFFILRSVSDDSSGELAENFPGFIQKVSQTHFKMGQEFLEYLKQ